MLNKVNASGAEEVWEDSRRSCGVISVAFVNLPALLSAVRSIGSDVRFDARRMWDTAPSVMEVLTGQSCALFLDKAIVEFGNFDRAFCCLAAEASEDARQLFAWWEGRHGERQVDPMELLGRVETLALAAQRHKEAAVLLMAEFAPRGGVAVGAGAIAAFESMGFWRYDFGQLLSRISRCLFVKTESDSLVANALASLSSSSSSSSSSLLQSAHGTGLLSQRANVLHRGSRKTLCFAALLRPAADSTIKAAFLQTLGFAPIGALNALSHRVYLDSEDLSEFANLANANRSRLVAFEWDDPANSEHAVLEAQNAKKGTFEEEVVPSAVVQQLLKGAGRVEVRMRKVNKLLNQGFAPRLEVQSMRSVFLDKNDPRITLVWDSNVQYQLSGTTELRRFPFSIITVYQFGDKNTSSVPVHIEEALSSPFIMHMQRFHEAVACMSLCNSKIVAPFVKDMDAVIQEDFWAKLVGSEQRPARWERASSEFGGASVDISLLDSESDFNNHNGRRLGGIGSAKSFTGTISIASDSSSDPKTWWANERTLLSWLSVSTFLALSSLQLLTSGGLSPQIAGTVMAPFAMAFGIYSLVRFHLRNLAIRGSENPGASMLGVVDWWGPWIVVPIMCIMLLLLVLVSFLF